MESKITKQVLSVKYLGITKLQWSEHVSNAKNKANTNSRLGFFCRNLKSCPPYIISSCYKSLVVSIISMVWNPHYFA